MKVFITLAAVCLFASVWAGELTEVQKATAQSYLEVCAKQEKVPEADVSRMRKRDFSNPSDEMKCFAACFFEQVGVLKDNNVQKDVAQQKLTEIIGADKSQEVIGKCTDNKGPNRCETGHKLFECVSSLESQFLL